MWFLINLSPNKIQLCKNCARYFRLIVSFHLSDIEILLCTIKYFLGRRVFIYDVLVPVEAGVGRQKRANQKLAIVFDDIP